MDNQDDVIVTKSLPAILIGGVPDAGKSVLTHNLTRELRRREIPHYVFRANPDGEGDWFLEGEDEQLVRQIRSDAKRDWSDEFRKLVCHDLPNRLLPLIVDLGGRPKNEDTCIFRSCTHSLLLLKEGKEEANQTWRDFTSRNGLTPLAELHSKLSGPSELTAWKPVLKGTITGLERRKQVRGPVFDALVERISQIFGSYSREELETLHLSKAPVESIVNLPHWLEKLAPDQDTWSYDLLQPLLAELSPQTTYAVYERGPGWLYGALALYAGVQQPFYQFDPRLGWVEPPALRSGPAEQSSPPLIHIKQQTLKPPTYHNAFILTIHLFHGYIDYTQVGQLTFPEPAPDQGIIIDGKLPLWLFTALARFYAQRNVPWIAFNEARTARPVVVWSQIDEHFIGEVLDRLPV